MEQGIPDQPANGMSPLARGFWIGAICAAGAVVSWPILEGLSYALDSQWLMDHRLGLMIALPVVAYLAGLAAAIKRPTRCLGLGILIGVTVTFPVVFMLTRTVLYALYGGG